MFIPIAILDQVGEKPIPNQFISVSLDSYFNTTILVLDLRLVAAGSGK